MSDLAPDSPLVALPAAVFYPERAVPAEGWLEHLETRLSSLPARLFPAASRLRSARMVARVGAEGTALGALSDAALRERCLTVRAELRRHGMTDRPVARSFALIRELAGRTIGLRHYDVQLSGGFALLGRMVAEMDTGEGKTLAATLPAATAALAGTPVHVITVNDYLARRDAEEMGPLYRALGLSVGIVVHGMTPDQRRAAYLCDITYCTNKEIAFDYLRDRLALGQEPSNLRLKLERLCGDTGRMDKVVMRGLHFAVVDEADSVLIDEARTPLIISGETDPADEARRAREALALVDRLEPGEHFKVVRDDRQVEITESGRAELARHPLAEAKRWKGTLRREEAARQALTALHLFHRDEHYLVRDDKIEIVDEYTGRVMADRSWSEGLHQLVEAKEDCTITGQKVPLARMTYQRFFRRYKHLCGMTGTARETAGEFWSVYRLKTMRIPTHRPPRRVRRPERICTAAEQKWRRIAESIGRLHKAGRPVLLGTRSVATSETASRYLGEAGLPHVVLSAAQDREEAEIIARAGEAGRITVATNMAGRGVDIKIDPALAKLGGLHVIMSERHDSGRIDRQLLGRCARQGEPGSTQGILSLDDPLLEQFGGPVLLRLAGIPGVLGQWMGRLAFRWAQRRAERSHARMRRSLLKQDQHLNTLLAFSGRIE